MRGRFSRWSVLLAVTVAMVLGLAGTSFGDTVLDHNPGKTKVTFNWQFFTPANGPGSDGPFVGPTPFCKTLVKANPSGGLDHFIGSGCSELVSPGKTKSTSYMIEVGDVDAGPNSPLRVNALSDSTVAGDSISITVTRGAGQITVDNLSGYLRVSNGAGGTQAGFGEVNVFLAVYPDSNVANADAARVGTGALLSGRAHLIADGRGPTLTTSGDLSRSHFNLGTDPATGLLQAVSNNTFSRTVAASNPNAVTIVIVSDPRSDRTSLLPGATPPLLGLLAALMLGCGLFFIARRRPMPQA